MGRKKLPPEQFAVTTSIRLTPAQSLQEHENEVIERVVTLLKDTAWSDGIIDMRVSDLIEDVRALKGKQNESALERMAENARELGLDYCKHGSDSACKECYMEKTK